MSSLCTSKRYKDEDRTIEFEAVYSENMEREEFSVYFKLFCAFISLHSSSF